MVGPGDLADHARLAGAVLASHAHGASARQTPQAADPTSGLVPQDPADLQRCVGARAPANLAACVFSMGAFAVRPLENASDCSKSAAFSLVLHALTVWNGQSPA